MNELEELIFDKKVKDYDFLKKICLLNTGVLYKCLSKKTGDVVAIKILTVFDIDQLFDIQKDLMKLIGKNLKFHAKIFDVFSYKGKLILVLEYFENGSLQDLVTKKKRLSEKECSALVVELLKFVKHFHEQDMFGFSIKPSQLFINRFGKIKSFIFPPDGLYWKALNKCKSKFIGSPYYMAPEVIRDNKISAKSDVWAIGITTFELVTGALPYRKFNKTKALFKIVNGKPPRLPFTYSKELREFINATLQKDCDKRASVKDIFETDFIVNASSKAFLNEFLFTSKDYHSIYSGGSDIQNGREKDDNVSVALGKGSNPKYEKGSLISAKHVEEIIKRESSIKQQRTPKHGENLSAMSLLKIKRATRKVEKMHPGLTQKIFTKILGTYSLKASLDKRMVTPIT